MFVASGSTSTFWISFANLYTRLLTNIWKYRKQTKRLSVVGSYADGASEFCLAKKIKMLRIKGTGAASAFVAECCTAEVSERDILPLQTNNGYAISCHLGDALL